MIHSMTGYGKSVLQLPNKTISIAANMIGVEAIMRLAISRAGLIVEVSI